MKCKLGDIAEITMGQSPKSEYYNSVGNGIPFLQGNRTFGRRYPIFDSYSTVITKKALAGDVLMSVRAPVGDLNITPVDVCLGRGVCSIRMKNGNQNYLYYLLKYNMPKLLHKESGTVFGSVNKNDIMELELDIVEDKIQLRVSRFLAMLDDKIEENEHINQNLEQQAQALYRQMFVADANATWEMGHLSDLVIVRYGKDHKKLSDGPYPVYGSGGIMRYVERPIYDKESVLIPRKGTLNNVIYVSDPFWSVDTMFYTEMRMPNLAKYVFHFIRTVNLAALNAGSAVPSMTTDILNALEIKIPDAETLMKFENLVAPMYEIMKANVSLSTKLTGIRDTLLPRLMSGELDVSDLNL